MWIVTYGGFVIGEYDTEEEAEEMYRSCGPYASIWEADE